MKRFLLVLAFFASYGFVVESKKQDAPEINAVDAETAQLRAFAKYAAVFRLLPARVSQMLGVVNAYPASNAERRLDLLQIAIQRLHEKYRTVQQLHDRVIELQAQASPQRRAGVHGRCSVLLSSIKKYQITLVSILSVLDAEFVRFAKTAHEQKNESAPKRDAAFMAAKASLNATKMDVLISMLVAGPSSPAEVESTGSVTQELRQLRDEVAQLNAQIQAKALVEGANGGTSNEFNQHMRHLTEESARASLKAKSDFGTVIDDNIEVSTTQKSFSSKPRKASSKTLQGRALAFHDRLIGSLSGGYEWIKEKVRSIGVVIGAGWGWVMALPVISTVHDSIVSVGGHVFNDTQKAAKHVEHRMKEVKEATPEGLSLLKESFCSFADWVVESWIRVGQYMLSLAGGLGDYWHVIHEKAQEFDEGMRDVACQVCGWFVQGWQGVVHVGCSMKDRLLGRVAPVIDAGAPEDIEKDIKAQPQSIAERLTIGVHKMGAACQAGAQSVVGAITSWKEALWPSVPAVESKQPEATIEAKKEEEKIHLPSWTEQLYEVKTMAAARLHECKVQLEVVAAKMRDKLYTLTGRAPVTEERLEEKK